MTPAGADAARFDLAPELFLEDLARVAAEPVVEGGGYQTGEHYTHRLASRRRGDNTPPGPRPLRFFR